VERELMLVKVRTKGDDRQRAMEIASVFRVNVVDVTHSTLTLEATGRPEKLEALLELLRDFGIVEVSRTGRIALARGERGIRERSGARRLAAVGDDRPEWTGGGV
jgi:acetolactate synthase-1/3 small subunit